MLSSVSRLAQTSVARLISHTQTPLYRNGYALILSSASTSGLGVVYWILAARVYATDIVGLNSAAISAMMFLAGISQLNLMSALMRFIPRTGHATRQFVIYAYLIVVSVAAVTSLVYILGLDAWSPALGFIRSDYIFILWFIAATMGWCVFGLQDSVLTGLRQATWVPIKNSIFAMAKLLLLLALAIPFPRYGIFASWTLALGLLLLPANFLIFRHLIPKHIKETRNQEIPLLPTQVAQYVAGDYLGALCWLMATTLMPVIVLETAGAAATAYFFLAWTIIYSLYNVSADMGASLIVEGARDQARLGIYSQRMFFQTAKIVVPIAALLLIGAPYILEIFGRDYAVEGTALLRLLALSAIPNMVTAFFISVARVQRRVIAIVTVLGSLCILVLILSYLLLKTIGITGVGWAWLISQSIVAGVLLSTQLRAVWVALVVKLEPLVLVGQPLLRYWNNRAHLERASQLIPSIVPTIPPIADAPLPDTWTNRRCISTVNDTVVIAMGAPNRAPTVALKLPQTDFAFRSLQRQKAVLKTLWDDTRLGEWRALLPKLLAEGNVSGQPYVVEQILPGIEARQIVSDPAARLRMQVAAVNAIGKLHRLTANAVVVNEERLVRWIDEPLRLIRDVTRTLPRAADHQDAIARLAVELRQALLGRRLSVSWVHGDFAPGNILVTPDGSALTGIVDWDLAQPDDLPLLDLIQLVLSTRMLVQRRELGEVLGGLLRGEKWTPHEQALLDQAQSARVEDRVSPRAMLLLCWLRHVSDNVTKSTRYANHWLWVAKNIEAVLECV